MKIALSKSNLLLGALAVFLFACNGTEKKSETAHVSNVQPYTQRQQVFSLCMLSNISAAFNGQSDLDTLTTHAVNNVLASDSVRQYIGNWTCVWGPIVYKSYSIKQKAFTDTAANTMFIARQNGTNNFVVAIAGTDPSSAFEWEFEDFNVLPVRWDLLDKSKGCISTGTATGLGILTTMTYQGNTAAQFLGKTADTVKNMQIWTTGHSLGGALSPVFALHLQDKWSTLTKDNTATFNCLCVAGASPGDSLFSNYYNQQLGKATTRVWNTRDVVPHGFEMDMMDSITTLYPKDSVSAFPWLMKPIIDAAKAAAKPGNYRQLYPDSTFAFTSAIYTKDSAVHTKPFSDTAYLNQAIFQHIPAYGVYFNTFGFQQAVQNTLGLKGPFFTQSAILVPVWKN